MIRIAMWSGPRHLSTAMMRAWENRPDTVVVDEPLYAHYLAATGIDHPMREEVLAAQPTELGAALFPIVAGPIPEGATIQFQKHMSHHVLPEMDLDWLDAIQSAFLIRSPRRVVASYVAKREAPTVDDLGIRQLRRIFDHVRSHGGQPPVLWVDDLLRAPRAALRALCASLAVAFDERMLRWRKGPRDSDGVWAPYWYAGVWASSGFGPPAGEEPPVEGALREVVAACQADFEHLLDHRLPVP